MSGPRRLIRRERALQDLEEQASYIAQDSLESALRLLEAAEAAFERLREMPGVGAPSALLAPRLTGLRHWPIPGFPNHFVFYRATDERVEVLRVLHAARDIAAVFAEESRHEPGDE